MRVGIITEEFKPPWDEGRKNIQRNLVRFLEQKGDAVSILSSADIAEGRFFPQVLRRLPFLRQMETFILFRRLVLKKNLDVLFTMLSAKPFFGLRPRIYEAFIGIPFHIYIPSIKVDSRQNRWFLRGERVFAGGEFIQNRFPGSQLIYPLVDMDNFRVANHSGDGAKKEKNILFLGAFQEERGLQFLLRAMAALVREHPVRLTIAWNGRGEYGDEIRKLIEELRLADHITLKGSCDLSELYNEAHAVVIPRILGKGLPPKMFFPLRIIEAMAFRKPLIVSSVYGWADSIRGCGIAVPPGDPDALKNAILKLSTDDDFYKSCVMGCEAKAQLYRPENILGSIRSNFERSIANR